MAFQNMPAGYDLTSLTAVLTELGVGALAPTTILGENKPFKIDVNWTINPAGGLVPFLNGTWSAKVYVESIGVGFEGQVGAANVTLSPGVVAYAVTINVPGGLPVTAGQQSTPYKMIVTLTAVDPGNFPLPIAGFVDEDIIQVFAPGP